MMAPPVAAQPKLPVQLADFLLFTLQDEEYTWLPEEQQVRGVEARAMCPTCKQKGALGIYVDGQDGVRLDCNHGCSETAIFQKYAVDTSLLDPSLSEGIAVRHDWAEPKALPTKTMRLPVMAFDPGLLPASLRPWITDRAQDPCDFGGAEATEIFRAGSGEQT